MARAKKWEVPALPQQAHFYPATVTRYRPMSGTYWLVTQRAWLRSALNMRDYATASLVADIILDDMETA